MAKKATSRSGRIELWLETKLPNQKARQAILNDILADQEPIFSAAETSSIASESGGLSGADLRRIVGDAKLLYARDLISKSEVTPFTDYLDSALKLIAKAKAGRERRGFAGFETTSEDERL